jgi:hypothetical protein
MCVRHLALAKGRVDQLASEPLTSNPINQEDCRYASQQSNALQFTARWKGLPRACQKHSGFSRPVPLGEAERVCVLMQRGDQYPLGLSHRR